MRDKKKLTQQLLDLLPEDQRPAVEAVLPIWWYNLRRNGGMRLTTAGYAVLTKNLSLENYEFTIQDPMQFTQQTILDLDRKLKMPYYIHTVKGIPRKIVFFGSREAMMANLYGNLFKFLENCE